MFSTDACLNCGSQGHSVATCPSHLGPTQPRPQQAPQMKARAFQYAAIPPVPNLYNYPTAASLVEDLHRWGLTVEYWARGMQSYAIQLKEVVTRISAAPHVFINAQGFSMEMQLPDTAESQAAIDNAVYQANLIVEQQYPGHRFELYSPLNPPSTVHTGQPLYSQPTASPPALVTQEASPSPAPSPPATHAQPAMTTPSPAPRGRGRGRGTGNRREGATGRGRVKKPRNTTITPTPRKRASRKKAVDEVAQDEEAPVQHEVTGELQAGGNTRGAGLKAGRDTKKVAALKNQAEKSADPFDVMLAAHLGQYAEGNERNTRSLSFPAGAYSQ